MELGGMMRMSLTDLATSWGRAPMMWANLVASAVIFFNVKTCSAWENQTLGSSSQKGVSLTQMVLTELGSAVSGNVEKERAFLNNGVS